MADDIFGQAGGFGGGGGGIAELLQQGINSPLLQYILKAAMSALKPGEREARQSLTDTFRSAGALRGGSYGVAVPRLEGELASRRGQAGASTISGLLGPIMQALLSEQRMTAGGGASANPWAAVPPSMGLATPMSGDTLGPAGGVAPTTPSPAASQPLDLDAILKMLSSQSSEIDYGPAGSGPDFTKDTNIYGPWELMGA